MSDYGTNRDFLNVDFFLNKNNFFSYFLRPSDSLNAEKDDLFCKINYIIF